mgnify:CR=1 FL=1
MRPRAAIFDLDGTVVDNMFLHAEAFAVFVERHGLRSAEQHEVVLARETGRGVCVRDQGGDVVAMYAAAPPA